MLTDFKFSRLPSRPRHSGSEVGGLEQQPLRPVAIGWYQAQGRVEPEQLSCMNMAIIYRVFCAVHRVWVLDIVRKKKTEKQKNLVTKRGGQNNKQYNMTSLSMPTPQFTGFFTSPAQLLQRGNARTAAVKFVYARGALSQLCQCQ